MKTLLVFAFGCLCAAAADQPVRQITSQAMRVGGQPVPAFQHGYLFFLDRTIVRIYPPDGLPLVAALAVPGVADFAARGLAIDADGSVAVAMGYFTQSGRFGGGIVFLDKYGHQLNYVDTGFYMPSNLAYGEDHSVWSFGWQRDSASTSGREDPQDYAAVRKYAPDGKEAGRYLTRSLFPKGLPPGSERWQQLRIAVSHNAVGLVAWSGQTSCPAQWMELDLNGTLFRRAPVENCASGFAYTADGHVYRQKQGSDQLLVLDQNTLTWKDTGAKHGVHVSLLGADGNQVVFSPDGTGPVILQWFEQPKSPNP